MPKPTIDELRNRFLYHAPGPEARVAHAKVSELCLQLAEDLVELCPAGRALALALTDLEAVRMRANQAIADTQPLASGV